jgi:hypothetical protein
MVSALVNLGFVISSFTNPAMGTFQNAGKDAPSPTGEKAGMRASVEPISGVAFGNF